MAALIIVLVIYILIVIWAKRQDKKDLLKVYFSYSVFINCLASKILIHIQNISFNISHQINHQPFELLD